MPDLGGVLTIRILPQSTNRSRTTINTVNGPRHDLLQHRIRRHGVVRRQAEFLLMPARLGGFADDVVFLDGVWFAHLGRDGAVEDEAVEPAALAVDDLYAQL